MDDDGEFCSKYVSKLFNMPAKIWDSTHIEALPDGKWLTFKDKRTNEMLNGPRLRNLELKIPYRYKGYTPREPACAVNPLDNPPIDNYTAFRARKKIYGGRETQSARSRESNPEIVFPGNQSIKYFKGDDPSRNPFRISTKIINERRLREARPMEPIVPRTVKSARRAPSLYKRSIKPKKQVVWPSHAGLDQLEDECNV